MRTSAKSTTKLLVILIGIMLIITVASPSSLAADRNCNGWGWGSHWQSYDWDYQYASSYYLIWGMQARAWQLDVKCNELDSLAKLYAEDQYEYIIALVDWTNTKIDAAVIKAQQTPWNDICLLMQQENILVDNAMFWGRLTGYEIECVYTPYQIDGRTVMIDPLRVVNTRK